MFRLQVVPAQGPSFEHTLEGESTVVGRSSTSDLVLADRFLSRQHARLIVDGEELLLEDLGSRNGTLLNGQRIEGRCAVNIGDTIQLSGSSLEVLPAAGEMVTGEQSLASSPGTVFRPAAEFLDSHSDSKQIDDESTLRKYAARLEMLNDVHRALAHIADLDELLGMMLESAFKHLQPEEGAIFLKQPDGSFRRAADRAEAGSTQEFLYSQTLVREVSDKGLTALVLDVQTDERFAAADSILASGVRSLVAAPLLDPEGSVGMIVLSSRLHRRQFSEDDMDILTSLASVAALRIRNVALAEEAAERRRLEEELALARRIQVALLPQTLAAVEGYEIRAGNVPSRTVSGDYYQVLQRRDGRECVMMVADVSGKGMAASLLTATLEALAAAPIEDGLPPEEIFDRLSRLLHQRTPPEKYATAFLAVVETETGQMRFANAGHNAGLLIRADGDVEQLSSTGPPIGLLPVASYQAGEVTLERGDALLLYTDGITEAENPDEEEYGIERLESISRQCRDRKGAEVLKAIESDVEEFAQGTPYSDDRTLVFLRRQP